VQERPTDLRAADGLDQELLVRQVADLASAHLDDERMALLIECLVRAMSLRADSSDTHREVSRRHARIQALIKRL